jgi:hypothetical protein
MAGVHKYIAICSKLSAKNIQKALSEFQCHFQEQQEDSVIILASSQEANSCKGKERQEREGET